MYRGDAPEIEHEDIIWNTSQTIMHSCALLDPNRNEFEKYQRMLLSLRQIALTIAKNRKEQEWVDSKIQIKEKELLDEEKKGETYKKFKKFFTDGELVIVTKKD